MDGILNPNNRKQFISIGGADSTWLPMWYGVPQGSILEPILFIIYITDIPGVANFAKLIHYADDANIITTVDTIKEAGRAY